MRRETNYQVYKEKCLHTCNTLGLGLVVVATLAVIFMFSINCLLGPPAFIQVIYVDVNAPLSDTVDKNFLSIGLDSAVIAEGFYNFNMSDERLIKRVRYLSPGYIRIGGNLADKLRFDPYGEADEVTQEFYVNKDFDYYRGPNFTMTGSQWLKLAKFCHKVGFEMIFDLNALMRFPNGSWDYRNAESLIRFSQEHKIFLNWELGNEPNSFEHKFGESVNASQLAKDFRVLKDILNKYPMYKKSLLVGPDVTRPQDSHNQSEIYLMNFLKNHGGEVLDKITFHQYYLNGRTARPIDFLDPNTFNLLEAQIGKAKQIIGESDTPNKTLWIGETASAYGGGAPNLTDTFIGTFLWVDKLGLSAKMGVKVVMRQSIFRGYYALLDDTYSPNPDWWISILYSNLVGKKLVPYFATPSSKMRFYVHCTKSSFYDQFPDSITIFGMNFNNRVGKVRIEGLQSSVVDTGIMYAFELTSGDGKLTSKKIKLNGKPLKILPDNTLPAIVPKIIRLTPFVTIPPFSVVFWIVPNTNVQACL